MAENKLPEQGPAPTPAAAAPQTPPPAPKAEKISTHFSDVPGFSGSSPESIDGRLAMLGFVATIGAELVKGDDVVAQIANAGLPCVVGTSVVLSLGSLVSLFKAVSVG